MFEDLAASISLDASDYISSSEDAADATEDLAKAAEDAEESAGGLSAFSDKMADVGKSMQGAGKKMTAGVTAPLTGIGLASIKAASDVEEMEGKMDQVFGDATDDVKAWADTTADEFNRSKFQMQEMATSFQDTFVPLGFAREEAEGMSKEMAELSTDLASFNNVADDKAAEKLESALVGNHQAVRDFGVVLTQERLDEQLEKMFDKGVDSASEQEKAMARLELIMNDTADAHGDAARTADSFANQMRGLKGSLKEVGVEIGRHLLPMATGLVEKLQPAVGMFGNLDDRTQKLAIGVGAVAAAMGPLLMVAGTLLTMLPAMASGFAMVSAASLPVTAPILAIAAAVGVLGAAFATDFMGIRSIVKDVIGAVMPHLERFAGALTERIPPATETARAAFDQFADGVSTAISRAREAVQPLLDWMASTFGPMIDEVISQAQETFGVWAESVQAVIERVRPPLEAFIGWLQTGFVAVMGVALDVATAAWDLFGDEIMTIVEFTFDVIRGVIETAMAAIKTIVVATLQVLRGDFDGALSTIAGFFEETFNGILAFVTGWGGRMLDWVGGLVGDIIQWFADLATELIGSSIIPDMFADILSAASGFASDFLSWLGGLVDDVISAVEGLASDFVSAIEGMTSDAVSAVENMDLLGALPSVSDFKSAGSSLMSGFADGISSSVSEATSAVSSATDTVSDYLPGSDAERGALSELTNMGKALPETLASGVGAGEGEFTGSVADMAEAGVDEPATATAGASGGRDSAAIVQELRALRSSLGGMNAELKDAEFEFDDDGLIRLVDGRIEFHDEERSKAGFSAGISNL